MSADALLNGVTQALYLVIFCVSLWRLSRRPTRANADITLLFGATALIIAISMVFPLFHLRLSRGAIIVVSGLLMALPYLTLRLVEDVSGPRRGVMRLAGAGLALSLAGILFLPEPWPGSAVLGLVAYFMGFEIYAALVIARHAREERGMIRRRMETIAAGSCFLGLVIVLASIQLALPSVGGVLGVVSRIFGLASGICYSIGFTPPVFVRRGWEEPELRAFLAHSADLPRLHDLAEVVRRLEIAAAAAAGAPQATIGLWDERAGVLRYVSPAGTIFEHKPGELVAGWAFAERRPVFVADAARADPTHADVYESTGACAVLSAPIMSGEHARGVLAIFAERAPLFAEDDLELVQLLADQAALVLESHTLIEESAHLKAREEATRLKEDFLSSAAHDLKSPLTGVLGQAQLMELRAARQPDAPVDVSRIQRIIGEARRMSELVERLLDAVRAEDSQEVDQLALESVDLSDLVRAIGDRRQTERHPVVVDAPPSLHGQFDRMRIQQVIENLVENAVKYSPDGGEICVRLWKDGELVHLTVTDKGIGIPPGDLPRLFDRFHRGSNVDDRRFAGLGLGLYICRRIVEQHGGVISATSDGTGGGATIHVILPATAGVESR